MGKLDNLRKNKHVAQTPEVPAQTVSEAEVISVAGSGNEYISVNKVYPVDNIVYHEDNVYNQVETSEEDLRKLARDIELNGLINSITVTMRPGQKQPVLLSGERRLKATKMLLENAKAAGDEDSIAKYKSIPCKVITIKAPAGKELTDNLRRRMEQLYLDAANLQARGDIGNEKVMAIVTQRYIENLMVVYDLAETEAKGMAKKVIGEKKARTVDRNWRLYKLLSPELYSLYVSGDSDVGKKEFEKFTAFDFDEQAAVVEALKYAQERAETLGDYYSTITAKLREKAVSLADTRAGEERQQRVVASCTEIKEMVDEAIRNIAELTSAAAQAKQNAKAKSAIDISFDSKKKKYIGAIAKTIKDVSKLTKGESITVLQTIDKKDGSITAKISELEEAIADLKQRLGDD